MRKKKTVRTSCLYIQQVPADLKSYFKAFCAKQEKTMRDVVLDFMKQCTAAARDIDNNSSSYGSDG